MPTRSRERQQPASLFPLRKSLICSGGAGGFACVTLARAAAH